MKPKHVDERRHHTTLSTLAKIVSAYSPTAGDFETPIAGLSFFRRERPAPPAVCMVEPCVVLVAQGAKQLWVGGQVYRYDTSRFLVTSLDLPANSEVIVASPQQPCLGLTLKLDLRVLAELIGHGGLPPSRGRSTGAGVGIGSASAALLEPFERLLRLLHEPDTIPVLAPLIQREIHYRLLRSDQSDKLRQIASVDAQGHRIAKAIDWLKLHYTQPLRIEELAQRVQMSAPTFHLHFRQLTAMSPLQYQKWLRLNEAKRLMLNNGIDAASAGFQVGYESPSQFSREYSRLFGAPPKRDILELRAQADTDSPRSQRALSSRKRIR